MSLWKQALILRLSGWVGECGPMLWQDHLPDKNLRLKTFQPSNRGQDPLFLFQIKPHSSLAKYYWPCFEERSLKTQTKCTGSPILEFYILSWMKSKVANVVIFLQYPGKIFGKLSEYLFAFPRNRESLQSNIDRAAMHAMGMEQWSSGVNRRPVHCSSTAPQLHSTTR